MIQNGEEEKVDVEAEQSENHVRPTPFRNLPSIQDESINTLNEDSDLTSSYKRRSSIKESFEPGSLNVLSAKYESLDYDICENHLMLDEERKKGYRYVVHKNVARWFTFLLIGICTALVACIIDISIEELSYIKYGTLSRYVDKYITQGNKLYIPYFLYVLFNIIPVAIGATLVAYVEPIAAGSGIPQVKCYLNGVKVPNVVRFKTLVVKSIGVVCSVVGGLAGGKEGPMIHSGAVVAAGISQGKSTSCRKDFNVFRYFREDHEKRDFVSGGAAAGVSAAFGAPVGGVLFSLEEGTSFWNQSLTWKTFFASVISTFTLNVVLSTYHGVPGDLSYPGLLNLGQFERFSYEVYELPIFVLMGLFGGILGSFWNHINYKLTVFRIRYLRKRWVKVLEACIVAAVSATVGFLMMFSINDCKPLGQDPTKYPTQMYCGDGEYNVLASIWFQTPEASVRSLFHDPRNTHNALSLAVFVFFYFFLATWTFGLSTSNGLFIPTLLTGAAWGRLVSVALFYLFPDSKLIHPGKYALIGAAAQLGGVVRMTISLTVIIMETTGNISFALPLIVTLIAAKWTGDFFNEGIYDIHIQLSGIPLLPWEPPPLTSNIYASEVMSHPVVTLKTVENVGHIVELLRLTSYNGFPVVDPPITDQRHVTTYGRIRGLILRSQLIVILKKKLFNETAEWWDTLSASIFRDEYPRYPTIDEISITEDEKTYSVDLRPFMNSSPYTVLHNTSLPRMFRLFRGLGLRHLPIVNDTNEVIGMVTRKDLARYRVWVHRGRMGLDELLMSKEI
ncbi:H(+)/Cl(-) exchange transporter 7 isoform X1 [Agrilus planipennis]|uniref:Chloride channel protein n=1 Tax=Agrilus planipennis TaxID=224129 RepID=A0A1W4WIY7_AGRPL|nr:H(+)/Cl(-) exchange transporter 7 isoform X2 [Agrilus planipennis]XP_025836486.1 H(+)/Cl(-) exchange transporter 7 isoform X1 [Agrilus planipennis]